MRMVGITGGIGAGKSALLEELAGLGARTVDADTVVHDLYGPGGSLAESLVQRWGPDVRAVDGSVNRPAVAERVFAAPDELAWLNSLVHPLVQARIRAVRSIMSRLPRVQLAPTTRAPASSSAPTHVSTGSPIMVKKPFLVLE